MQLKLTKLSIVLTIISLLIATITGIMTYVNLSPTQDFIESWVSAFIFAFLVMLPIGMVMFLIMSRFVNRVFISFSSVQRKLIQGVLMAILMESILAVVTTSVNHDYINLFQFFNIASTSFIYAIPVGLTFACLMTLVIQPKLEGFLVTTPVKESPLINDI
tara:strand:- start:13741 stop:14223 length:483 start_codon:yes stop_codon:yes gene_type:complete